MRIITVTLFVLSLFCCFQTCAQADVRDSAHAYQSRIERIYRQTWDSLRKNDSILYYQQRLRHLSGSSKAYTGLTLYSTIGGADFNSFNTAIAKDGFTSLRGPMWGFGIGVSTKGYNGVMFDIGFFTIGANRSVKKGSEAISYTTNSLFQTHFGYALVNGRVFTLYPYGGLSIRFSSLEYAKPQTVNPTWNSIASIVQNNQAVLVESTHLGYQAGLGMDLLITRAEAPGGIILFGKFGTNGIFGHDNYDIYGVNYVPGIKYGTWEASFGFKFMGRR